MTTAPPYPTPHKSSSTLTHILLGIRRLTDNQSCTSDKNSSLPYTGCELMILSGLHIFILLWEIRMFPYKFLFEICRLLNHLPTKQKSCSIFFVICRPLICILLHPKTLQNPQTMRCLQQIKKTNKKVIRTC